MDAYLDTAHRLSVLDHQQRLDEAANARLAASATPARHHHARSAGIGEILVTRARTVQAHVATLVARLGVNSRAEAPAVAARRGIA